MKNTLDLSQAEVFMDEARYERFIHVMLSLARQLLFSLPDIRPVIFLKMIVTDKQLKHSVSSKNTDFGGFESFYRNVLFPN